MLLAAIAVPEQLATARLAHMPPQTGLYAFAAGTLAFALFGANRLVSVGADSTIAPIFAGGVAALAAGSSEYAYLVTLTAFMAGVILVCTGLLRAGWIADLLSIPVTIGFLAGIGVHIIVGQLPAALGIAEPSGALLMRLVDIVRSVPQANGYAVAIGAAALVVTVGAERINARIPGALIALCGAGAAVALLHLNAHGVAVVGALPAALPALRVPFVQLRDTLQLVPLAFVIALVCIVQTAAVIRAFPSEKDVFEDPSPDFGAVGAGSILASLLGAFAVDASPPRTAVAQSAGARSQLTGVVAVAAVGALVLFGSGLASFLPTAALGGVLISIGLRIFRVRDMLQIARHGRREFPFVIAGILLVVIFPIETGMLLSIALSLTRGIYNVARPPSTELVHLKGTTIWWPPSAEPSDTVPGVVVFAAAAPVVFTNVEFIVGRLLKCVAAAPQPVRLVVLEASSVSDVDYTGAHILRHTVSDLKARGIEVAIARLSDQRAEAAATRSGLLETVGIDCVYKSVHEALLAFHFSEPDYSSGGATGA